VAHGYLSGNDGLNRFFVSEYFRTVVWLMDIFRETMVSIASSSANTSGRRQVAGRIHCKKGLNRFFVSEYFRTAERSNAKKKFPLCSIASSSANTSGRLRGYMQQSGQVSSLNRFFVSEYFRTFQKCSATPIPWKVSIASSSANTSGRQQHGRRDREFLYESQSLLRQRILPDVNILPASDIIEDGLNRFFVSEYFRTFFAGDSQTAQIIASLNRFFVSEYFRT